MNNATRRTNLSNERIHFLNYLEKQGYNLPEIQEVSYHSRGTILKVLGRDIKGRERRGFDSRDSVIKTYEDQEMEVSMPKRKAEVSESKQTLVKTRKKYVRLTVEQKQEISDNIKSGMYTTQSQVAKDYDVGRSTVSKLFSGVFAEYADQQNKAVNATPVETQEPIDTSNQIDLFTYQENALQEKARAFGAALKAKTVGKIGLYFNEDIIEGLVSQETLGEVVYDEETQEKTATGVTGIIADNIKKEETTYGSLVVKVTDYLIDCFVANEGNDNGTEENDVGNDYCKFYSVANRILQGMGISNETFQEYELQTVSIPEEETVVKIPTNYPVGGMRTLEAERNKEIGNRLSLVSTLPKIDEDETKVKKWLRPDGTIDLERVPVVPSSIDADIYPGGKKYTGEINPSMDMTHRKGPKHPTGAPNNPIPETKRFGEYIPTGLDKAPLPPKAIPKTAYFGKPPVDPDLSTKPFPTGTPKKPIPKTVPYTDPSTKPFPPTVVKTPVYDDVRIRIDRYEKLIDLHVDGLKNEITAVVRN
jgi:hypothetical protein